MKQLFCYKTAWMGFFNHTHTVWGLKSLLQFCEDFVCAYTACQQFFQHVLCFSLLSFFSGLSICLYLLRFHGCRFFFGLLQSNLLLFQVSFQSVNVGSDGSDLGIQRRNCLLLLRDLGCVVIDCLRFVLAAFGSGQKISAFLLCVVVLIYHR